MLRGKTNAETCFLNKWDVGDILEGDEGGGPERIIITAIGFEHVLAFWERTGREASTVLSVREWKKVGSI